MGSTIFEFWLGLVAFIFAVLSGGGLGWILAERYWLKLLQKFQTDFAEERKSLYFEAARDRDLLLTRIQGWEPEPKRQPLVAPTQSNPQATGSQPTETAEWTGPSLEELAADGIVPNSGGDGFVDLHSNTVFDTVEDIGAWRAMLRHKKLPITLSPALASDMGFKDAIGMARRLQEKQKKERIAEESGDLEATVAEG